jgi:hypothetical protein
MSEERGEKKKKEFNVLLGCGVSRGDNETIRKSSAY